MDEGQGASFGERLRRLREAAGLTQEELAERAGLTPKGIGALERGDRKYPYPNTVQVLAGALNLSGDERAAFLASVPRRDRAHTPRESPPAVSSRASNLPVPPTSLVGRESEIGEVGHLLLDQQTRLLTLTGPGGVGKTRLSIEAASRTASEFPDGVAFVALAPLEDPELLPDAIARAQREGSVRTGHARRVPCLPGWQAHAHRARQFRAPSRRRAPDPGWLC